MLFLRPHLKSFKKINIMAMITNITKPITDKLNVRYLVGVAATIAVVLLMVHFFVNVETDDHGKIHFGFNNPFSN